LICTLPKIRTCVGRRIPGKMDVVDAPKRSQMMAGIRSKNTKPEITVRKFLHSNGFRYSLHSKSLPGSPDIVLRKYNVAVFIHGCFWHRHDGCKYATIPSSNIERWESKFRQNTERDRRNIASLRLLGWKTIVVWECELRAQASKRLKTLMAEILAS